MVEEKFLFDACQQKYFKKEFFLAIASLKKFSTSSKRKEVRNMPAKKKTAKKKAAPKKRKVAKKAAPKKAKKKAAPKKRKVAKKKK